MMRFPLIVLSLSVASWQCWGAEPWADPALKVTAGLAFWFDASRAAGAKKTPPSGKPLEVWRDASGFQRDLRQPVEAARATWHAVGQRGIFRFDGEDDHFRGSEFDVRTGEFTIFAVVAPQMNLGTFRGIVAFNAPGERDYTSGLTLDQGPGAQGRFAELNVEGRGFGGAKNLLTKPSSFGKVRTLEVRGNPQSKRIQLYVDGEFSGERPWTGEPVSFQEMTLGARFYSHDSGPQRPQNFGCIDLAEVLVYSRCLGDSDASQVRSYLQAKYADLEKMLPPRGDGRGQLLAPIENPPAVQVLRPGFSVHKLPLDLTNINNIKYRADGILVALGYNGNVWILRDSDGDGIEDQATLFYENKGSLRAPIGMALTPANYPLGDGVFVACKGKIALLLDKNRDGEFDEEITVAGPWKEIINNVDALGVAVDPKDGSIFYGRGSADFTNAYQINKDGKAGYQLTDETGTIIRISPDFKKREIVATGIRFPVALAFNRAGDLFATDQEGATWMPNGNPLDELLHIQPNRHYGFPPRHPKHLPNVIDEPSTFDYGPQHQSTCGLCFNEPVKEGGPTFGPANWAGNAFVTGYSRGKLYRTTLAKSPTGYVASNELFACLSMLTVDCCITPDGGLLVACHGGGPDWGSGPTGKGALFKIKYSDPDHPQPVLVYTQNTTEVRVEFDRPVAPELLRDLLGRTQIVAGKHVRAGDRFETLWPGYAVVQMEKSTPRYPIAVRSAQMTPDRRTLILATDPMPAAVHYAIQLPGMGRNQHEVKTALLQHDAIDLDFTLTGVQATWTPEDGRPGWTGWLPHLDLQVSRQWTAGSVHHDKLWNAMKQPGTLTLECQLQAQNLLRPAVQPGSQIDHTPPPEVVELLFASPGRVQIELPREFNFAVTNQKITSLPLRPKAGQPVALRLALTGSEELRVDFRTQESQVLRPFSPSRVLLPGANTDLKSLGEAPTFNRPAELEGGSWAKGRTLFFSEPANCSKCHSIHGTGGNIGPDLSNLVHRDYASVLRDITNPSFAINPDHVTSIATLADGRVLTGVARTTGNRLQIGTEQGDLVTVSRADVESLKLSPVSIMPDNLVAQLGTERLRDLMTFLLLTPPSMPKDYAGPRPPPRAAAEVHAALAGAPNPPEKIRPLRLVLTAGPKDHGKGEHDYPAWQKAWKELLAAGAMTDVETAWEWPSPEQFRRADVIIFYQRGDWNGQRAADIDAYLERGGGLVYIHWAVDGRDDVPGFAKRIGLAARGGQIRFRHGPLTLDSRPGADHPVLRNIASMKLVDESYWKLTGDMRPERVLMNAIEEKQPWPQVWTVEPAKGRVFVSIPGHYSWTFDDPLFRVLLLRGIAWTAREPVDRFNDLVWPGADFTK